VLHRRNWTRLDDLGETQMFKAVILAVTIISFAAAVGTTTGRAVRGLVDDLAMYSANAQE
jgi:hypothetical protein